MRVVITGGCGFLGRKLAERIVGEWSHLDELVLVDQVEPPEGWDPADDRISVRTGDVTDERFLAEIVTAGVETIYHLASVVSAGAEQDFDLGYSVNLLGTIALLERCRRVGAQTGRPIQIVFTSSCAAYGSDAGNPVDDSTILRPESSYGVQKASCELLINDYHRKGFIDGRGLRLPTVVVRPGKPNKAASGFASGIIREPLSGVDAVCPVAADTVIAVISPRRVVDALAAIVTVADDDLGADRILLLPGLAMVVEDAVEVMRAEGAGRPLGRVHIDVDPEIQRIVSSWPPSIVSERAARLGFRGDESVTAIVRQHIEDELES